jgi:F0F1-type ATP synthase assembly protein I
MSENYEELLDQTVDEVKDSVNDLEEPDYEELLEAERNDQDRKTVKDFLQEKIDTQEHEVEETAEEIEEETAGGVLGSFDREKVLVGGVLAGLVIGLVLGFAFNMQNSASQTEVRDSIQQFYEASGNSPDSLTVQDRNGMFYATANISQETPNGTQTSSQSFYVSPDGELLFPEVQSPFLTNPYRISDLIAQAQQQQQPSGNTTQ